MTPYPRDMVGYGKNPPHANWPNGARLAINFVLNFEEGSEPSVHDGEDFSERLLTELGPLDPGLKGRDIGAESMFAYGTKAGFWRVLRLFQERQLTMTINGCALALERNPAAAAAIVEADYDVCCHGWRWIKQYDLPEAEEREFIAKAVASLRKTVGQRPFGWNCRYGPGPNTRRLLLEEGGFLYDSDSYEDDLPYWIKVDGKDHLIIPYSHNTNDTKFVVGNMVTGDEFFHYCRDAIEILLEEGAERPKMMSVGLHMRLIGHPSRAAGLKRLLDYVASQPDIWVTRRIDIAHHWIANHGVSG